MAERLAFWCVLLQLPVYIAQKDAIGGLGWEQTTKGVIFFWWALAQNITPIFAGGFADRYGNRRILALSAVLIVAGYSAMALNTQFWGFLAGALLLGFGSGIFKPALYGLAAKSLTEKSASAGWGVYAMAINSAVFMGPPLAIFLKGIAWEAVFFGAALVFSAGLIALPFIKITGGQSSIESPAQILKNTLAELSGPRVYIFLLLMSGFTIVYMQFYETLPNFILDWTDSGAIAQYLPSFMTSPTHRGEQIAFEWYYNLNAGLIAAGVAFASWYFSRFNYLVAISFGAVTASIGLFVSGATPFAGLTIAGFLIYTFGEMITNPKFNEYMARAAGATQKSTYMGLLNLSWAVGLGGGSLLGGYLYKHFGEKSLMAIAYLESRYGIAGIQSSEAFLKLCEIAKLNPIEAEALLWSEYSPWLAWAPFLIIGIASAAGLLIYKRKY